MSQSQCNVIWYRSVSGEIVELRRADMSAKDWDWSLRQLAMLDLPVWTTDPRLQGATA